MSKVLDYSIDVMVLSNITLIGNEKGTEFDYKNGYRGAFSFTCLIGKGETIKFKNIIFKNYLAQNKVYGLKITSTSHNFFAIMDNYVKPQVLFNKCKFLNNHGKIIETYRPSEYSYPNIYKSSIVQIKDSIFINNYGVLYSHQSKFILDNCYISELQVDTNEEEDPVVFFFSKFTVNFLDIKNSIFENINVKGPNFIIESDFLILEINNTTFRNTHTDYGYLFSITSHSSSEYHEYIKLNNIVLNDSSSLLHGNYNNCEISNSVFQNITMSSVFPVLTDSKYSNITILNTLFENLNIINGLIDGESGYIIDNVKLRNINSNSKAIFKFIYHDIFINNIEIENIKCNGEGKDSSFIFFDSGEDHKKLTILNSNIKDSISNGPFIKAIGNSNDMIIRNTNINNITSYGSVIENISTKATISISNLNFTNNRNINKMDCGSIHFSNDLHLSIKDSQLKNNIGKINGGALCINNILNMELYLISNIFENNNAINGGALYLGKQDSIKQNINRTIVIKNNIFRENIAENFGGGIYSEYSKLYLAETDNNTIIHNEAGIMGGGAYSPKSVDKNLFDIKLCKFENNTVNSDINDYSSKPSFISLNTTLENNSVTIITGGFLPLQFLLHDEFGNIMKDITKYYSSITLKLLLENEDNKHSYGDGDYFQTEKKNVEYILYGNLGSFINGKCELNNFRIFANPNKYHLKFKFDNYKETININFDDIEIKVLTCKENQIKMYDKNGILHCENPICDNRCPIEITAYCKSFYEENINDINKNECKCLPGWKSTFCGDRQYVDFSYFDNTMVVTQIPLYILLFAYIIFIILNKKAHIIKDQGYYKILLFSFAFFIYNISNFFSAYNNYAECSFNFIFKHIGISLMLVIFFVYIMPGLKLGIQAGEDNKLKLIDSETIVSHISNPDNCLHDKDTYFKESKSLERSKSMNKTKSLNKNKSTSDENIKKNNYELSSINLKEEYVLQSVEQKLNIMNPSNTEEINDYQLKAKNKIIKKQNPNSNIMSYIEQIHSSIIKILIIYPFYVILIFFLILIIKLKYNNSNKELSVIQSNNGNWIYKCDLENVDFFFNCIDFLFLIIMLINGKKILKYQYIFKCTKYIIYSLYIGVAFGPLINIYGYLILNNQRYSRIFFEYILNSICYSAFFILLSWDKVYYIIKKESNNPNKYFLIEKYEKCSIHNSLTCGCQLNRIDKDNTVSIKKYINFYKLCTSVIEFQEGSIRIIKESFKLSIMSINDNMF
ncbi:hypothetical protein H8356DRAFT_1298496 [Neocallimastix lanati (nom. inval.)]|nr:hypothetical protein H8356DRAFT_1298496 [Neocallimastix sp. JGI-2020a]